MYFAKADTLIIFIMSELDLLKCPSPKILYFLIWNYTLLK